MVCAPDQQFSSHLLGSSVEPVENADTYTQLHFRVRISPGRTGASVFLVSISKDSDEQDQEPLHG